MVRLHRAPFFLLALAALGPTSHAATTARPLRRGRPPTASTASGGIRVRPDKGPAYNRLIEQSGLPLFREAGGRMVGWWKTLIGDLYEHVTIWEYDDMAAFERAIGLPLEEPRLRQVRRGARPAPGRRREPVLAAGAGASRRPLARAGPVRRPRDPPRAAGTQGRLSRIHDPAGPRPAQGPRLPPGRSLGRRRGPMVRGHVPLPVREPGRARAADRRVLRDADARAYGDEGRRASPRRSRPACWSPRRSRRRPPMTHPRKPARPIRAAAAPGADSRRGLRGRLLRPLRFGQLRLGRAGRRDPADRRAPRDPGARFLAPGRRRRPASPRGRWCSRTSGMATRRSSDPCVEQGIARVLTSPGDPQPGCSRLRTPRSVGLRALADRTPIGDATVPVDFLPLDRCRRPGRRGRPPAGPGACCSPARWSSTAREHRWPAATRRSGSRPCDGWRHSSRHVSSPGSARGAVPSCSPASDGSWPSCAGRSATISPRAGLVPASASRSASRRLLRLDALRQPDRRGPRARLPRADRAGRPVPRPRSGPRRIPGRTPWS